MSIIRRLLEYVQTRPGRVLALAWPLAFIVTHLPRFDAPGDEPITRLPLDKVVHFGAYAFLGWLLTRVLLARLPTAPAVTITILLLAGYGALDEVTQPPIGRTADVWDFVADIAGAVTGALVASLTASRRAEVA